MSDPTPKTETDKPTVTLGRCLLGALIAGVLAIGLYTLTASIAQTFAAKPPTSSSLLALNIAIAVRTLVVGVMSLATAVFSFVSLGLIALGLKTAFFEPKEAR